MITDEEMGVAVLRETETEQNYTPRAISRRRERGCGRAVLGRRESGRAPAFEEDEPSREGTEGCGRRPLVGGEGFRTVQYADGNNAVDD